MKTEDFVTTEEKQAKLAYDAEDLEHIDLLRKKTLELRKMIAMYILIGNSLKNGLYSCTREEQEKKYDTVYKQISLLSTEIKAIIGTHFL
jgi:hypothetical protein